MPRFSLGVVVAALVLGFTAEAAAQGRVRGVVRDRDGNGVEGASISAESLVSQASQTAVSNPQGRFTFIGLNRGEWLFAISADGFEPVQGFVGVRASGPATRVTFTMDRDLFNPPAPDSGVLAGLKASELAAALDEADAQFDEGQYEAAIQRYREVLEEAPAMTSLHLSIGHAFLAQERPEEARAAFRQALEADPENTEAQAALSGLD